MLDADDKENNTEDLNLSQCDIISQTPEKPVKKKRAHISKDKCSLKPILPDHLRHLKHENTIAPKTLPKTYIYNDFEEILSYSDYHMPKHNYMRLIGLFKMRKLSLYYLENIYKTEPQLYILVDFQRKPLPAENAFVEVFGYLEFATLGSRKLHRFAVNLWRPLKGDVKSYIRSLQILKNKYVPVAYLESFNSIIEHSYIHASNEISIYFDEVDESMLDRKADYLEEICLCLDVSEIRL